MSETPEERIEQFSNVSVEEILEHLNESTIVTITKMYNKITGNMDEDHWYREGDSWISYGDDLGGGLGRIGFVESAKDLAKDIHCALHGRDTYPDREIKPKVCALVNVEFGNPENPKSALAWVVRKAYNMWDESDYDNPAFEYNYRYKFDNKKDKWIRYSIKG